MNGPRLSVNPTAITTKTETVLDSGVLKEEADALNVTFTPNVIRKKWKQVKFIKDYIFN